MSRTGEQPMFNEDGTVCVVFNGEIYNFRRLMAELAGARPSFPHALRYRSHRACLGGVGRGLPRRASTACSPSRCGTPDAQTLFLARDRLGKKPLYYCLLADGRFAVRIRIEGLAGVRPRLAARLDPQAIEDYLRLRLHPRPAVDLSRRRASFRRRIFCSLGAASRCRSRALLGRRGSPTAAIGARRGRRRADRAGCAKRSGMRMIADVPLGAFLSGGVDSSAVVAMMAG